MRHEAAVLRAASRARRSGARDFELIAVESEGSPGHKISMDHHEGHEGADELFEMFLGKTKLQEARGASRGNAFRGSNNVISLSLRFGLQSIGFWGW
jgi:hypothetical protein